MPDSDCDSLSDWLHRESTSKLLRVACRKRPPSLDEIRRLVEEHPDWVREQDRFWRLPLHDACESEPTLEVVRYLVELYPESVNVKDSDGHVPLDLVRLNANNEEIVSLLESMLEEAKGPLRSTKTVNLQPLFTPEERATDWRWSCLIDAPNGRIYGIQMNMNARFPLNLRTIERYRIPTNKHTRVLRIDPKTNEISLIDYVHEDSFHDAVLANNGCIFSYNGQHVLKIDTNTDTTSLIVVPGQAGRYPSKCMSRSGRKHLLCLSGWISSLPIEYFYRYSTSLWSKVGPGISWVYVSNLWS